MIFYSLGVNLYTLAIRIASLWNAKARKWVKGRRDVWRQLSDFDPKHTVYWFHCASLGEFEQGRPLMEEIKDRQGCKIVVTFYSPSGYEIRKNYNGADLVVYLPKDSKRNARKFLNAIQPNHVFFIKYEFWAHYLFECEKREIPVYSVAALFRKEQIFFKFYGGFMRKVLKTFDKIFVQNKASQELLESIQISSEVCGDTRFDRVMKNAEEVKKYPEIRSFCGDHKVLVCGSIWAEDLEVIKRKVNELSDWKIIIAPHEISERFIHHIESAIKRSTVRYSKIDELEDQGVLIIDNIGMLMNLYQYGSAAFIGGAYRTGLHNVLEPAAFGLPVFFGDKYEKFPEAYAFIEHGIGCSVKDANAFNNCFEEVISNVSKEKVLSFMRNQMGATTQILNYLSNG